MSLIRKFDPRAFRSNAPSTQVRPFVEPAKAAKAAKAKPSASLSSANFSKFSSFSRTSSGSGNPDETWSGDDWQAYFEERAAIREYSGGLPRDEAERLALDDAIAHWLCLNPVPATDPRCGCIYCNTGEQASNCLVPVLTVGGHVWVHDQCWEAWRANRHKRAAGALRRLGLPSSHGPPVRDSAAGVQGTSDKDFSG